jgi:isopentenyldiphosphate isomerase
MDKKKINTLFVYFTFLVFVVALIVFADWWNAQKVQNFEMVDLSEHGEAGSTMVTIQLAHQKSLTHRGTWVIIVDETEKLMLFTKRSSKIYTCPNTWSWVGEHTRANETYSDAAIRGVEEELGIVRQQLLSIHELPGSPMELMHLEYHNPFERVDHQWVKTYVIKVAANALRQPDAEETGAYRWVPMNQSISFISQCDTPTRCRACTDATNIYSIVKLSHNETRKIQYADLKELIVSKINIYMNKQ